MITDIMFLPHGMQIIPGVEDNQAELFLKLNHHMDKLSNSLGNEPEEIILLTPHGYNLTNKLLLYNHILFEGLIYKLQESVVHGDLIETFQIKGSEKTTRMIEVTADNLGLDVEVLTHGYPAYPLQLNWGTSVPLYYFKTGILQNLPVTIICYPRTRHTNLDEIITINEKLVRVLNKFDNKIFLMISGDLSHVHKEDGPYGIHESAVPFDNLVMEWAKTWKQDQMDQLLRLQTSALACGMAGLNLIHQVLQLHPFELVSSFYEVPTYFGMGGMYWSNM